MFVSVDGKAKEVAEIFAGGTDGKAHKVTELFGSVNGIAKQLWTSTPPEPNGFDKFTWAEIKQLANEGKLLEHFNLYDRVMVKLKTPLTGEIRMYMSGHGIYENVPQYQDEMLFQIIELTETKMRLMCPRVTALGNANATITPLSYGGAAYEPGVDITDPETDSGSTWLNDFKYNEGMARETVHLAWGLFAGASAPYPKLKAIQNALPDDLLDVLSVCAKPLSLYKRHHILVDKLYTEQEDMKVRQITTNKLRRGLDTSDYWTLYPIVYESYYPDTVGEYLYHIRIPAEYDTYAQRRYLVNSLFGWTFFLDYTQEMYDNVHTPSRAMIYSSISDAPYVSCYYSKGITTNEEYERWLDGGGVYNMKNLPMNAYGTVFPEIVLAADGEDVVQKATERD